MGLNRGTPDFLKICDKMIQQAGLGVPDSRIKLDSIMGPKNSFVKDSLGLKKIRKKKNS